MPLLTAAVVVLTLLVAVDLVLTLGVVARLREHTRLLAERPPADDPVVRPAGDAVPPFAAVTTAGAPVTRDDVTLAGFFSPHCGVCAERIPGFLRYAERLAPGRTIAVVVGEPAEAAAYAGSLAAVGVVVEPEDGPVAAAFAVRGYPAFCLLDDAGVVAASGWDVAELPQPART